MRFRSQKCLCLSTQIIFNLGMLVLKLSFVIGLWLTPFFAWSSECSEWFQKTGIKPDTKNCEINCSISPVNMGNFYCTNQCPKLCQTRPSNLGKYLFYPGLTPSERKLVETNGDEAIVVFTQKVRAEYSSSRNFPKQHLNDEGDAFRHFVWSGLLTKAIGSTRAKEYLDAHEADPDQPMNERKMDEFNNSAGQKAAEKLGESKEWGITELEKEGLKQLRELELNVLKPGLEIPKEPK
jgi:hypothetical protein